MSFVKSLCQTCPFRGCIKTCDVIETPKLKMTKPWLQKIAITGIYKITSPSGRVYIGQSWHITARWRLHRYTKNKKGCPLLNNSFLKYGTDAHKFEIIHKLPQDVSQEVLDTYEIFYLNQYKETGFNLMNLKEGGGNGKPNAATLLKMSNSMKGKTHGFKKGMQTWNKGTKGICKAWNKGLKGTMVHSEINKKKTSERFKGHKYGVGKKMTEVTRLALNKANTGRKMPSHVKEILSKFATPEKGKMMGLLNKGKVRTVENRNRISQSLKNRTDNKGELHPMAKLTGAEVLEIRNKYVPREYSLNKLAKEYNTSKRNVLDIIHNKIWTNL